MGMFDSVMVAGLTCEACGTNVATEVEVQFKAYIGRTYTPLCNTVRIGEALETFPPIPVFDADGCWDCPKCDHFHGRVRVRIERGVVASVAPFADDERSCHAPEPRDPEKLRRRHAWLAEMTRRRVGEFVPVRGSHGTLAQSMETFALRLSLYQGLVRQMFKVEPMGTLHRGPYRKVPEGRWERAT